MSLIKGKNLYTRDRKKSVLFKVYPYKQLYPYKGVPYKWLLLYFILQIGFYCGFLAVLRSELDAGNYVLDTSKSKIADK